VGRALAPVVREAVRAGRTPLILAGSCDASMGVLAGVDHAGWGVVWLDAHGDFNTPESTVTGFFPGMSLATITGHCYRKLWAESATARRFVKPRRFSSAYGNSTPPSASASTTPRSRS
jgi:arginase family enzyme